MLRAFLDGAVFGTTTGDGVPSVLVLHGWRRTHEDFDQVAAELEGQGVGSVALDLPGFGHSPMPREKISISGYARTLDRLLEELRIDAAAVVDWAIWIDGSGIVEGGWTNDVALSGAD